VFWGVGALIDYDDWLVNLEYTELGSDQNVISDDEAWYVMLGRRIDEFTLHVTYSEQEDDPDYSIISEIPEAHPLYEPTRDQLGDQDTSAITVGLRYDFAPATAFKVEVTEARQEQDDTDGTLVAFAIDTVF